MIDTEHFPERAVDIPREVDNPSLAELTHVDLRDVGLVDARPHHLHGQVGVGRDQRQRRVGMGDGGFDLHPIDAVDDAPSLLQSGNQRVEDTRGRVALDGKVGILHRSFVAAGKGRTKEIGQPEVLAALAPLIVKRRLVGGDQAAAVVDKGTQLLALFVGKGGDIGQDQRLEGGQVFGVEQAVVHHLEGDTRLHQRMVVALRMVLDTFVGAITAVVIPGLLRIDHGHTGNRCFVAQVGLPLIVEGVHVGHRLEPARIVDHAAELGKPGAQPIGDAVGHEKTDLLRALDRIFPAVAFFDAHAEDATNGFAAQRGTVFFAVFAVGPTGLQAATGLTVGKEDLGLGADALHVEPPRGAARIGDIARMGLNGADLRVPHIP